MVRGVQRNNRVDGRERHPYLAEDRTDRLAMRVALLRALSNGELDMYDFCAAFLYSANDYDVHVSDVSRQIFLPTTRELTACGRNEVKELLALASFAEEGAKAHANRQRRGRAMGAKYGMLSRIAVIAGDAANELRFERPASRRRHDYR
jgi:hypothetical protein